MPESPLPPPSADDLQFTTAESGSSNSAAAESGQNCLVCHQPIVSTYFALGDKLLCPACCARVNAGPTGSRLGRVTKASFMGLGAGLVGALIWFAIRRVTHLEIGLVAVLVGFMVGKAVRKGSGDRGGRRYQVLAVVLTYCCIAANYMPDVLEAALNTARKHRAAAAAQPGADVNVQPRPAKGDAAPGPAAGPARNPAPPVTLGQAIEAAFLLLVLVFAFSLAVPFLGGFQNLIGILIIGFALWEAWKLNARRRLPITGPYQMGTRPMPATAVEIVTRSPSGGASA
jgi:hypothetical protein